MMVVLTELYPRTPLSLIWIVFHGHSSGKQFKLKMVCSYLIKLKLWMIVDYEYTTIIFILSHMFKEDN